MNETTIKYHSVGKAVLRVPAISYKDLCAILVGDKKFEEFIRSDIFQESLYYASPDLYDELIKYIQGKLSEKDSVRLCNSAVKYIERMGARCTPFATFAGCGVVDIDKDCNLDFAGNFKKHFRYDMQFLCQIVDRLLKTDKNVYKEMRYIKNPTILRVGDKYRYECPSYVNGIQSLEINMTGILRHVLKVCSKPVSYGKLEERLRKEYDIDCGSVLNYVFKLTQSGLLICDLAPNVIGYDYFDRLYGLAKCSKDRGVADFFEFLNDTLSYLNSDCDFQSKHQKLEALYFRGRELNLPVSRKSIVQVDSTFCDEKLSFPKSVLDDLRKFMLLYSKLTPRYGNNRLQNFAKKFESRYEGGTVPLIEALNPDVGIGYVDTVVCKMPVVDEIVLPRRADGNITQLWLTPFQKLLLNKMFSFNRCGVSELVLTDDDFENVGEANIDDLPLSMAAMFKIVGYKNGKYIIAGLHYSGNSAINMLSRFCDGDISILSVCKELAESEQNLATGKLLCEISHLSQPRTGNVLLRPCMRNYNINYLTSPNLTSKEIQLSDIYVCLDHGRLQLSLKDGRIIEPRLSNAHNYNNNTSSVYKFLCDMQAQRGRSGLGVSWGGLENVLNHLPRLMYKNLILSYERWILDVDSFKVKNKLDIGLFRETCRNMGVCRKVRFVESDNTLYVDIENDMSVKAFISAVKNSTKVVLEEFLPVDDGLVAYDISPINEFIVPFIKVLK